MGFSKKQQIENTLESESKKWVIAGISLRSLKPINTKVSSNKDVAFEDEEDSTTPTAKEARIPMNLSCPPAPRKQRISRCNNVVVGGVVREFFTPPDLETVFKLRVEKSL
ncbi:unnamed protein product [Lathyrus oleraceus]|uniref:cyclin-dependent protein kinase inhibitor SMR6 n=1 Tax=Pisum sativum TaxID=3888 RepID=UPI001FC4A2A6|nr:cyclin-dependent protein kinase inhibitor SMR6 [Pisum sativum]